MVSFFRVESDGNVSEDENIEQEKVRKEPILDHEPRMQIAYNSESDSDFNIEDLNMACDSADSNISTEAGRSQLFIAFLVHDFIGITT